MILAMIVVLDDAAPQINVGDKQSGGITVTGRGSVSATPDVAQIDIGIEVSAKTVADSRQRAARAMTAVMNVLDDEGVEENGGPIDIGPVKYSTETILQGIRVLGIDQQFREVKGEASVAKSTTLEVSPKQAEILAVARAMGKLSLTLRSKENDNSELTTKSLTTDVDFSPTLQKIVARIAEAKQRKKRADYKKTKDLPHSKAKPVEIAPKPVEPILKEVRVIRGDVQSIQKFPSK